MENKQFELPEDFNPIVDKIPDETANNIMNDLGLNNDNFEGNTDDDGMPQAPIIPAKIELKEEESKEQKKNENNVHENIQEKNIIRDSAFNSSSSSVPTPVIPIPEDFIKNDNNVSLKQLVLQITALFNQFQNIHNNFFSQINTINEAVSKAEQCNTRWENILNDQERVIKENKESYIETIREMINVSTKRLNSFVDAEDKWMRKHSNHKASSTSNGLVYFLLFLQLICTLYLLWKITRVL